jgi:hypothetical protein
MIKKANKSGLYTLTLRRISKMETAPNRIIRFPKIFESLCRSFQISKGECWELLFLLREFGFIDVIQFQGVKINKKMLSKVEI